MGAVQHRGQTGWIIAVRGTMQATGRASSSPMGVPPQKVKFRSVRWTADVVHLFPHLQLQSETTRMRWVGRGMGFFV